MNRLPDQNDDAAVEAWTNAKLDVLEEWDARFVARNQDEIGASLDYGWREIDIARGATVGTSPQDFHKVLSDRLDGKPSCVRRWLRDTARAFFFRWAVGGFGGCAAYLKAIASGRALSMRVLSAGRRTSRECPSHQNNRDGA